MVKKETHLKTYEQLTQEEINFVYLQTLKLAAKRLKLPVTEVLLRNGFREFHTLDGKTVLVEELSKGKEEGQAIIKTKVDQFLTQKYGWVGRKTLREVFKEHGLRQILRDFYDYIELDK